MLKKETLKTYKPVTKSMRFLVTEGNEQLTKGARPHKALSRGKTSICGRNNTGRITCRHRGGGHKRTYRQIDFVRNKFDVQGSVVSIEYDPNRGARIALIHYADKEYRYILATDDMQIGSLVKAYSAASPGEIKVTDLIRSGNAMELARIPEGTKIHNISNRPNTRGSLVRGAGTCATLLAKETINGVPYATIRFPSGEMKKLHEKCHATIGVLSNRFHSLRVEGKAGRNRWKGFRPTVRGTMMNPCDHPHGGGNDNIGLSPWGLAKGVRTRSSAKSNKFIVARRRK